jgi:hypothetical protein
VADLQGRIIMLTQTYIRDEIETYEPAPADLDYPAALTAVGAPPGSPRRGEAFSEGLYPPLQVQPAPRGADARRTSDESSQPGEHVSSCPPGADPPRPALPDLPLEALPLRRLHSFL